MGLAQLVGFEYGELGADLGAHGGQRAPCIHAHVGDAIADELDILHCVFAIIVGDLQDDVLPVQQRRQLAG
jgi:hypothetical protein